MAIRVFVYDDHADRRAALKALLSLSEDFVFAGEANNSSNALDDIEKYYPDVVLMDVNMPGGDGIEGLKKIKQTPPHLLLTQRVRIPNFQKLLLMIRSNVRHQLNLF